jgi:hypothetical protein
MYPTTNDYKLAIAKNARAHRLTGTVAGTAFDGGDVIGKSFVVKNQLCPATNIQLGGVYVGEMDLVFTESFALGVHGRGSWRGVEITASVGVEIEDGVYEDIPLGVFTVESATWIDNGLKIVAYDRMARLDQAVQMTQTSGKLYDYLVFICGQCDLVLGMTQGEVEALPNGTDILGLYPGSAIQTYRDMVSQLAVVACCFATIDRSGRLVFRHLSDYESIDSVIPAKLRYSTAFSDFESYYTTLEVENMKEGETASYYYNDNVGGLTLSIGQNPFLQYGTAETVARMRQAIIDSLESFRAVPFSASILPDPSYDLGDSIQFPGGRGQSSVGCVMSTIFKVDSTKLEGYGENPAASNVQSTLQKEIGAQQKSTSDTLVIHTYTNTQAYTLNDHSLSDTIVGIDFATLKPTIVTMQHEINLDLELIDEEATVTAYYYLDEELQTYHPVGTFSESGKHIIPLMYFLNTLVDGMAYEWRVKLKIDGGTGTIARGDVHAWLQGQGLVAVDEFSGTIRIEDEYVPLVFSRQPATIVDDVKNLDISALDTSLTQTDFIDSSNVGDKNLATIYSHDVSIDFAYIVYALCDDSGDFVLCDDSGEFVIVNSDGGYS